MYRLTRRLPHGAAVALFLFTGLLASPWAQSERVDLDAIVRIKEEGLQRSQVMDTAWYLTDVHGPRLTNSPGLRAAADWTTKKLTDWGLANVRQEKWGIFGRGWVNDRFTANVLTPTPSPLLA